MIKRVIIYSFVLMLLLPFLFLFESSFFVLGPSYWNNPLGAWGKITYSQKDIQKCIVEINNNYEREYLKILKNSDKSVIVKQANKGTSTYINFKFFQKKYISGMDFKCEIQNCKVIIIEKRVKGIYWETIKKIYDINELKNIRLNSSIHSDDIRFRFYFYDSTGFLNINKISFYYNNNPNFKYIKKYITIYNLYNSNIKITPLRPIINSILLSIIVGIINSLIFIILKFYWYFKHSKLLMLLSMLAISLPFPLFLIPQFKLISSLGLVNSYLGLLFPFIILTNTIYYALFFKDDIDKIVYEQTMIDGGSKRHFLMYIYIPYQKPIISLIFLISFISFFNAFIWPMMIVQSDELKTLTLATIEYKSLGAEYIEKIRLVSQLFLISIITLIIIFFRKNIFKMYVMDEK